VIRTVHADSYMDRKFDIRTMNCWHLARDVWRDLTGVDLGDLTPPQTDTAALDEAAWQAAEGPRFVRLERPRQPCIVLMRRRAEMPHVGVLMRFSVLHIGPKGVRNTWLSDVEREWDSIDYYLPATPPEAA
jgi:hypothetical protein